MADQVPADLQWIMDARPDPKTLPDTVAELLGLLGWNTTLVLMKFFGGQNVYVPRIEHAFSSLRNQRIKEAKEGGAPVRELAKRFKLSESQVRRIVAAK